MTKNKKQLSIFKRIGLIAIAFFSALGSLLLPFASKKQNNFASANTNPTLPNFDTNIITSTFNSSNFIIPLYISSSGRYILNYDVNIFISGSQSTSYFNFDFTNSIVSRVDSSSLESYSMYTSASLTSSTFKIPLSDVITNNIYSYDTVFHINGLTFFDLVFEFYSVASENSGYFIPFNGLVKQIDIFSSPIDNYSSYNFIRYTDTNNSYVQMRFKSGLRFTGFESRTYYLDNNFTDDQIYDIGYADGLKDNQQNVYDNGYASGKIAGEAIGYDKGVLESNNYSFKSLFGAVIDAPIKAFSGLFHFEFLGVNLLDFFFGLLTFGVIIFVIKLLLGGK